MESNNTQEILFIINKDQLKSLFEDIKDTIYKNLEHLLIHQTKMRPALESIKWGLMSVDYLSIKLREKQKQSMCYNMPKESTTEMAIEIPVRDNDVEMKQYE